MSDHLIDDADRDDTFEMPPEHVVRAMSQIAIYAATYGTDSMYLRDPVVSVPIGVVQEWLKLFGYEFGEMAPAEPPLWYKMGYDEQSVAQGDTE